MLTFCLFWKEKKTHIIEEIEKLPEQNYYNYDKRNIEKNIMKINKNYENIELNSSDFSGLGKSTLIKNNFNDYIFKNNYEYTYFLEVMK